jgi:hypothetical protein
MGVSFKVSKIGTRYRPKPVRLSEEDDEPSPTEKDSKVSQPEVVILVQKEALCVACTGNLSTILLDVDFDEVFVFNWIILVLPPFILITLTLLV